MTALLQPRVAQKRQDFCVAPVNFSNDFTGHYAVWSDDNGFRQALGEEKLVCDALVPIKCDDGML